jgi:hypothetical protein
MSEHQDMKSQSAPMLHLRMPKELLAVVEREAAQAERTLSQEVRFRLRQAYERNLDNATC